MQFEHKLEHCKPHKAAHHPTKYEVMTLNYFRQYIAGYTVANFWRYPIRRRIANSCALEKYFSSFPRYSLQLSSALSLFWVCTMLAVADPEGFQGFTWTLLSAPRFYISYKNEIIWSGSLELPSLPLFLNILWKWNNLVSVRPNYFIFMGYLRKRYKISKANPHTFIPMNHLSRNPGFAPVW